MLTNEQLIDLAMQIKQTHRRFLIAALVLILPLTLIKILDLSQIITNTEVVNTLRTIIIFFVLVSIPASFFILNKRQELILEMDNEGSNMSAFVNIYRIRLLILLLVEICTVGLFFFIHDGSVLIFILFIIIFIFTSRPSEEAIEKLFDTKNNVE